MRVDKELIEELVQQILGQLTQKHGVENVLIIGSRNDGVDLQLSSDDGVTRRLFYSNELYDANQIDRYILPCLELNDMADLALGKTTSPLSDEVLKLLMGGKNVEVVTYAFNAFENTAPPKLFQLYCNYAETLEGFGIRPYKKVQKTIRLTKRVISEQDLEKCHAEGLSRVGVADNALVTSLAEDCAKKFGIEIQRG